MYKLKGDRTVLGRGERTDIRVLDDGVSREHSAIERDGGKMVLVDLRSTNGTFCNGERVQRHDLKDGDKISIGATTILRFTYQDQVDEHYQKKLFESALRDGLTSTFNRRYFVDRLQAEIRFAVRHDKSLALLFADIDHFKKINDTHGHLAGDAGAGGRRARDDRRRSAPRTCWRATAARSSRSSAARSSATAPWRWASGCARPSQAHRFEHAGKVIPVTISVGAAVERKIDDAHAFIAAADAAMYEAKRDGPQPGLPAPGR